MCLRVTWVVLSLLSLCCEVVLINIPHSLHILIVFITECRNRKLELSCAFVKRWYYLYTVILLVPPQSSTTVSVLSCGHRSLSNHHQCDKLDLDECQQLNLNPGSSFSGLVCFLIPTHSFGLFVSLQKHKNVLQLLSI